MYGHLHAQSYLECHLSGYQTFYDNLFFWGSQGFEKLSEKLYMEGLYAFCGKSVADDDYKTQLYLGVGTFDGYSVVGGFDTQQREKF